MHIASFTKAGKKCKVSHRNSLKDYLEYVIYNTPKTGPDLAVAQHAGILLRAVVSASGTVHVLQGAIDAGAVVILAAIARVFDEANVLASVRQHKETIVIGIHQG